MLYRTHLVQGDHTAGAHADGEHGVATRCTNDLAVDYAHGDGLAGRCVDQAAGGVDHVQGVGGAARAVGTVVDAEDVGEAGRGVGRQVAFVHGQGCRGRAAGGHARCVVFYLDCDIRT